MSGQNTPILVYGPEKFYILVRKHDQCTIQINVFDEPCCGSWVRS
jgi:hypothetical protein